MIFRSLDAMAGVDHGIIPEKEPLRCEQKCKRDDWEKYLLTIYGGQKGQSY